MPSIERNNDGVIINAEKLVYEQVLHQRVLCPICKGHVFEDWPFGWDAHAEHQCTVEGATPEERKKSYRAVQAPLFADYVVSLAPNAAGIDYSKYIDQLVSMRMNTQNGHTSPHKAIMMLAVIDLIAGGETSGNRIEYGPELLEHFKRYFDVVKTPADSCTPLNPFWHLKTAPFWHHSVRAGQEAAYRVMDRPRGPNVMTEIIDGAFLEDGLFAALLSESVRQEIREAMIRRYFSEHFDELMALAEQEEGVGLYAKALRGEQKAPGVVKEDVRDLAFARVVKQAYHFQCAACGLRIWFEGTSLVDAAHIIPFSESHDDDPRNGLTLCKNHHWAMDQEWIFPCSDNKWHVRDGIDDRVDSQRALIDLHGKTLIPPHDSRFSPKAESLRWRERRLRAV
ncbi:HNH endonuclease [Tichowtungia aerotolerans]|uniref:HNH nuclease domain-containing protein n=1 Tax=Tichowtungia aerotolerans TaxID=2697043 RepID=A0A6P1MCF4_9BACT|nr:HNH endonuclease [Tichowtungia aerotolerans]QHI68765.1 hypothetical protein GT409_04645 [Tichowtungia aerotolerans]